MRLARLVFLLFFFSLFSLLNVGHREKFLHHREDIHDHHYHAHREDRLDHQLNTFARVAVVQVITY